VAIKLSYSCTKKKKVDGKIFLYIKVKK